MKKIIAMAAISGALLSVGAANATTIIQTASISDMPTNWGSAPTDSPAVVNLFFNQFDTSLGVLNSITLNLVGDINGAINIFNQSGGSVTINGSIFATETIKDASNTIITQVIPSNSGSTTVGAGGSGTIANLSGTQTSGGTVPIGDWLAFEGTSLNLPLFTIGAVGGFSANGGNNIFLNPVSSAGAFVTLTYDYTIPTDQVPEPASLALLGAGLAGIGLIRRRFKSN